MLIPITTTQFEKDVKKAKKQGKDIGKLKKVMKCLIDEVPEFYLFVENINRFSS